MSLIKILKDNIFLVFVIVVPIVVGILSIRISCLNGTNEGLRSELSGCIESKAMLSAEVETRVREIEIISKSHKSQEKVRTEAATVKEFIVNESVKEGPVSDWLSEPVPSDLLCRLKFLCDPNKDLGAKP